jgi:hypothetical protein
MQQSKAFNLPKYVDAKILNLEYASKIPAD